MRTIKFRAWDKNGEVMRDWDYLLKIDYTYQFALFDDNAYVFLQFTGLKDKNGKEIYDGDVLFVDGWEYYKNCEPHLKKKDYQGTFVVELEVGHWGLNCNWRSIKGYSCSTHIMGETNGNAEHIEIIGNIMENPELLKTA